MSEKIDIDKLKEIYELGKSLSSKEYKKLLKLLSDEEVKSLRNLELGLSKEDEFILISKLLGKCINIQNINQSKYIKHGNSIPPDFIATYKKNIDTLPNDEENIISMFIEVKRRYKEYWKISNRDYDRRMRYAKINKMPLFFAINFTHMNLNLWTLFPAEFIKKNNFKVHFMEWGNNLFDLIVGNLTVHFNEFELTKIYSKTAKSLSKHPEYGGVEKIIVSTNEGDFEFSGDDPATLIFYILDSKGDKIIKNKKVIRKKYYYSQFTTLYQILIGCIKVLYGEEENFSLGKYLKQIVDNGDEIIDLNLGYYILEKMEAIGIATHFIMNPELP